MLPEIRVDSIRQVYNDGNHNAFTDLCRYRGRLYLTFRNCPHGHMIHDTSRILILSSERGLDWAPVFSFSVPGRDVRDPHFLEYRGRLFVYSGTWLVGAEAPARGDPDEMQGYAVWSDDGEHWNGPQFLEGTQGHYIWRAAAFGDHAYLCSRRNRRPEAPGESGDSEERLESALLRSADGLSWEAIGLFRESYGNETAFLFEEDGSILAIHRGRQSMPAELCRARPPYRDWTRIPLGRNIGGPLLARWGERYLVGGRNTVDPKRPKTALYWLLDDRLCDAAELPSGGDTSYPGFVALGRERGLLSYYSSHEGSGTHLAPSAIYLAELGLAQG
ncbi:MAG: hypothetical protein FJZ90_03415 [Chloroflexi bacterium]|nr:hypothetical protein [Chloroflexota bacterium]